MLPIVLDAAGALLGHHAHVLDLVPTVLALLDAKTSVPLAGTPIPTQAEAR